MSCGGLGGLQAALKLRRTSVEVTLVDRRNFHLFQPLTYQVATGALSPGEIAYPLRAIFKRHRNVRVLMAEVFDFDLEARELHLRPVAGIPAPRAIHYDTLIVAGGARHSYFGHDDWSEYAAEVKSRERTRRAQPPPERIRGSRDGARSRLRARWLTFVVVGAGPTGAEMAGQIAELARDTLRRDFRTIDPRTARILLVEAADRVLTGFPPALGEGRTIAAKARRDRAHEPLGDRRRRRRRDGRRRQRLDGAHPQPHSRLGRGCHRLWPRLEAGRADWSRARQRGACDRRARSHAPWPPRDLRARRHGPGARGRRRVGGPSRSGAGRHAAGSLRSEGCAGSATRPPDTLFRYRDKGNLATIGRAAAVADIKGLRLSGLVARITWLVVHLWYLIGFQNRVLVLIRWSFSFATHGRGARLITDAATKNRLAPDSVVAIDENDGDFTREPRSRQRARAI